METSAVVSEQECYAINTACYREVPKIQGLPSLIPSISIIFLASALRWPPGACSLSWSLTAIFVRKYCAQPEDLNVFCNIGFAQAII